MEIWQIISSIASAIAAGIAGFAAWQAIKLHKEQQILSKTIHDQQILLSRRQLLLPLWDYLDDLADIDTSEPVWEDVRKASNILELVAVCWEGQMIDEYVIRRFFAMTYIEFYEKIGQCLKPPANFPMDGPAMLRNSPATIRLYKLLIDEHAERNKILPIQ